MADDLFVALWLLGIAVGLGLTLWGLLKRSAGTMLLAAAVLAVASIPGLLGGAGIVVELGALLAVIGARRMKTFPARQGFARALTLSLLGLLALWLAYGLVSTGHATRPSPVDLTVWALLAAMTLAAWWPVPAQRVEQLAAKPA